MKKLEAVLRATLFPGAVLTISVVAGLVIVGYVPVDYVIATYGEERVKWFQDHVWYIVLAVSLLALVEGLWKFWRSMRARRLTSK